MGLPMPLRDFCNVLKGGDLLEFLAERFAAGKTSGIRHQSRAHRSDGLIFILPFLHRKLAMALNQGPTLGEIGWR